MNVRNFKVYQEVKKVLYKKNYFNLANKKVSFSTGGNFSSLSDNEYNLNNTDNRSYIKLFEKK